MRETSSKKFAQCANAQAGTPRAEPVENAGAVGATASGRRIAERATLVLIAVQKPGPQSTERREAR